MWLASELVLLVVLLSSATTLSNMGNAGLDLRIQVTERASDGRNQ